MYTSYKKEGEYVFAFPEGCPEGGPKGATYSTHTDVGEGEPVRDLGPVILDILKRRQGYRYYQVK